MQVIDVSRWNTLRHLSGRFLCGVVLLEVRERMSLV